MGKYHNPMGIALWCVMVWISGYCHRLSADVLKRNIYFSCNQKQMITLPVPSVPRGREFRWEWTSHDDSEKDFKIAVIEQFKQSFSWTYIQTDFDRGKSVDISMKPNFQKAGVFSFSQTRPNDILIAEFEVFAFKVEPSPWPGVPLGSDVSGSCSVSRLPESATLHWDKKGSPASNNTLLYNNSAHILIHNVGQHSQGRYTCTLEQNGLPLHSASNTLHVIEDTHLTSYSLYRDCSNSTETVLSCMPSFKRSRATWLWVSSSQKRKLVVALAEKEKPVNISTEIDRERFSSDSCDEMFFPLRISPVKFQDAGRYICFVDRSYFKYIILVTLQVLAEPPGGLSKSKSVVLNCEISQVIGSVTLAWLRMEGDRGVLVKQEVLSQRHPKRTLSLTLPSLRRDQLRWTCAVFTESTLGAQAPLHLTLLPVPTQTGVRTETVVRVVVVVAATLGILVGLLRFYCKIRPAGKLVTQEATRENHEPTTPDSAEQRAAESPP